MTPKIPDLPCGTPTEKDENGDFKTKMVVFDAGIRKIQGIYRKMDQIMCHPCYEAKRLFQCKRAVVQTGDVTTRDEYRKYVAQQLELQKIAEKMRVQQKLAAMGVKV